MRVKKFTKKDRHGNMMSFEFDVDSELGLQQVPPMGMGVPRYKAVGGLESNHPGEPKGKDTVPAWLTPGEFVVNKEATDMYGPIIKKMNDHGRAIQNGQKPPAQYANTGKEIKGQYQDNVKRIYTHLKNKWKLNNNQIGAVLGQIGHETGGTFDYQMLEKNVDASVQGQGLFQNTPGKNRMLEPYLKYLNKNELTNSPESQIDFFMDSFMTKGAVPREDNPNTKENEASPWYHGSKKADRMRDALMNKDLRVNVGWKDKDPSLVGELTRFINVPGESLKSRDNWTTAGLQWANEHGMKVVPGLPKDGEAGNLYEAGATTSFPGEEKYDQVVPMEKPVPTWTDRAGQIKDKFMDNFRWNEGGSIPPAYLEHGGWHWGEALTTLPWNWDDNPNLGWDKWNYDPAKDPSKNIPNYIGPPISAEQHDKMWGGRPDDNNPLPESWKGYADHWEGATGEGSGYETNDVPIVNTPPNIKDDTDPNVKSGYQGRGDKYLRTGKESQTYIMPQDWNQLDKQEKARIDIENKDYYYPGLKWKPGQIKVPKLNDPDFWRKQHSPESFSVDSDTLKRLSLNETQLQGAYNNRLKAAGTDQKKIAEAEEWYKKELAKIQAVKDQTNSHIAWQKEKADYLEADKIKSVQENNEAIQNSNVNNETKKLFNEESENEIKEIKKNKKQWINNVEERAGENAETKNEKSNQANKLISDTDKIAKKKVDTKQHSESTITQTGEEGTDDNQKKTAMGMIQSFLGPLFDTQELKRMAVIYLGSRLLGYDHGGSLQYAAKSYLGRVDKKDAAIQKWVLENYGKVTPKSLQKFLVTRNPGDLIPIGARAVDTGETAIHYGPNGSEVRARKFTQKGSDGQTKTMWYLMDGKTPLPANFVEAGSAGLDRTKKTPAWDKEVARKSENVLKVLDDVNTRFNLKKKGSSEKGTKNEYHFQEYLPSGDVHNIAEWAHKEKLDMVALKSRVGPAFKKMIQDKQAGNAIAGNSILPYLKEELIKFDLGKEQGGQHFYKQTSKDKTYETSQANMIRLDEQIKKRFTDPNKAYQDFWNKYKTSKNTTVGSRWNGQTYEQIFNHKENINKYTGLTPFAAFVHGMLNPKNQSS